MISIVIPLYNVEGYILPCLKSIDKQTYRGFEVIIVNDGSTDSSLSIAESFSSSASFDIRIISQENQGVSKARNTGIENAKGEYLCFVDADDILASGYLETMLKALDEHRCDVCICNHEKISEECDVIDIPSAGTASEKVLNKHDALKLLLYGKIQAGIWALMTKKEILAELRFAEGYRYSEDLEMVWRIVATAEQVVAVNQPLYGYRVRSSSAMSIVDDRRMDGLKLFIALGDFLAEKDSDFHIAYEKYGVSRWVWSTLWQEAAAANGYRDFCKRTEKYHARHNIKKLLTYPAFKVKSTSLLYLLSKRCFYLSMSVLGKRRRQFS